MSRLIQLDAYLDEAIELNLFPKGIRTGKLTQYTRTKRYGHGKAEALGQALKMKKAKMAWPLPKKRKATKAGLKLDKSVWKSSDRRKHKPTSPSHPDS